MGEGPDWFWWIVAAGVAALFLGFFLFVGKELWTSARTLIHTIQNWPQIRRAMVEAEARAGGRYPWWFRAVRVTLILALVGLLAYYAWYRFGS